MTKIDPTLLYSTLQSKNREGGKDILGKDDFLKILMTQLQNQDPMNPMQDKDFIAQMATFSSLEQMTNLTKTMETFVDNQNQAQMISYNQFVGKQVTWHKIAESGDTPEIVEGQGMVSGIRFKSDRVEFILEDGTILEPGNISQVNENKDSGISLVNASMLIGKKVTWEDQEGDGEQSGIVQSVSTKDSRIYVHTDTGVKVLSDLLMKIES
ncbi:flagellar hook assembly protein FlgD [Rossellomorea aquimaris]|uniref:flagellar hook assembly protein FlgD n=1 Tax=Rossellomorea aquimaris TaxID=189382 RepID=UPI001CD76259|nr:flagellar hook assembly protein FlgD [Rossellomorea aquimaris]MCA1053515.1 flagellar hook assembly protein FlgD [Rossellomorea aquimaris]